MEMKKRKRMTSERLSHKFNKLYFINCYTYKQTILKNLAADNYRMKGSSVARRSACGVRTSSRLSRNRRLHTLRLDYCHRLRCAQKCDERL
jgi:hypothetical protein